MIDLEDQTKLRKDLLIISRSKSEYLLKRLIRYYCLNSKQIHYPDYKSGRRRSVSPSGTGRGKSRQPRARVNGQLIVSNIPNAVGGPVAHRPSRFSKKIKINKKELTYLKRNAYSIVLRRRSTVIFKLTDQEKLRISNKNLKMRDLIKLIYGLETIERKVMICTEDPEIVLFLRNHKKIELVNGFKYDKMLRGGIKDKTFIIDSDLLEVKERIL